MSSLTKMRVMRSIVAWRSGLHRLPKKSSHGFTPSMLPMYTFKRVQTSASSHRGTSTDALWQTAYRCSHCCRGSRGHGQPPTFMASRDNVPTQLEYSLSPCGVVPKLSICCHQPGSLLSLLPPNSYIAWTELRHAMPTAKETRFVPLQEADQKWMSEFSVCLVVKVTLG